MVSGICLTVFKQKCRRYDGAGGTEAVELGNFYINGITRTVEGFGCHFCSGDRCYAAIDEDGNIVKNGTADEPGLSPCTYTNRHLDPDLVGSIFLKKTRIHKPQPGETRPLTVVYSAGADKEKTAGTEEYPDSISASA